MHNRKNKKRLGTIQDHRIDAKGNPERYTTSGLTTNSDLLERDDRDGAATEGAESDLSPNVDLMKYQMIPAGQREQYMMQYRGRGAAEDLRPVNNSDIIQFDHFMYVLRDNVYT